MTDILFKVLYMVVVIIGLPFIILAYITYIILRTYVTLTIPILWIILRVAETLESEEPGRKVNRRSIMDVKILGMAPWWCDYEDENEDDEIVTEGGDY